MGELGGPPVSGRFEGDWETVWRRQVHKRIDIYIYCCNCAHTPEFHSKACVWIGSDTDRGA